MLQAEIPAEAVPARSSVKLAVFTAALCSAGRRCPSLPRHRGRRGWRLAAPRIPFPRGQGTGQTSCFASRTFSLAQAARWVRKSLLPSLEENPHHHRARCEFSSALLKIPTSERWLSCAGRRRSLSTLLQKQALLIMPPRIYFF